MLTKEIVEYVAHIDECIDENDFINVLGQRKGLAMYIDYSEIHDCNICLYLNVITEDVRDKLLEYINRTFPRPPKEYDDED